MLNVILMVFETGGTLGQITLLDGGVAEVLSWKKSGAVPWLVFKSFGLIVVALSTRWGLEGLKSYGHF